MNRTMRPLLAFALTAGLAGTALAQSGPQAADKAAPPAAAPKMDPKKAAEMQKMMEAMQAYATLGPEHARMKAMAGTWDVSTQWWMEPGAPAQTETGKVEMKPVLADHYLLQEFSGNMMGQPFQGWGLMGYDNALKKYESVWADSMGTGLYWAEGTASKDGNTINFTTEGTDPMKKKIVKGRQVLRFEGDKKVVMEMYGPSMKGKEYKVMEITYTRK
jgi:hypothetical protein